jgi:formate hydrogenlyase subunit 6/NADH:ubiquinone oxidoreductase subunit I
MNTCTICGACIEYQPGSSVAMCGHYIKLDLKPATDEEIARQNDDHEYKLTRERLLEMLPNSALLDRYTQAVMNRAVRTVTHPLH